MAAWGGHDGGGEYVITIQGECKKILKEQDIIINVPIRKGGVHRGGDPSARTWEVARKIGSERGSDEQASGAISFEPGI